MSPEISEPVLRRSIFEAARRRERLFVSIISIWEVSLLATRSNAWSSKQPVWTGCDEPWRLSLWHRLAPLTAEIAVECNGLPGQFHNDPADRIITATARVEGLTVVTRDRQILDYAAQGYVSALAC